VTRRLRLAGAAVGILLLVALFGPLLASHGPVDQDLERRLEGPSREHPFGLDELGRDILSRLLWGARVSMLVGFTVVGSATLLGLFISLPVAWFGALNITPFAPVSYPLARFLMTLSRSIHEIVWALIFVAAVGLGSLPGILAIAMRSVGFISKITAEAIENVDPRPVEAIRATGGNRVQVLFYGIVPQVLPVILGTIIFEWDINIRRSAVMGLVGAGGLGLVFFRQMAMFNYGGVTMVVLAVLVLVALGEVVSHYARKAVI